MSFHLLNPRFNKADRRFIDRAMMLIATIQPITAIPQAVDIYANRSAGNVSLTTWLSFTMIGIVFTLYAVSHRIKPLIINQIIWFIVDGAIVIGILLYGH